MRHGGEKGRGSKGMKSIVRSMLGRKERRREVKEERQRGGKDDERGKEYGRSRDR